MAAKKAKKMAGKKAAAKPAAKKAAKRTAAKKAPAKRAKGPAHKIVHWEIQSKSPEKLHQFYTDVFAWKIDANNPMNYGMVSSGGTGGINGGIGGTEGPMAEVLVYASTPSIDATLEKVARAGGRTLMPRTDIGPVTMAIFQDPEGNTFGLVEG